MLKLLDLFCGAGGCSMGYSRAGFEVTGVDIKPQKRYPFNFIQGDALTLLDELGPQFDVIHASCPCQKFSTMTARWGRSNDHPDLITPTRKKLIALQKPYVLENVEGAPLINAFTLCGSMFNLGVRRHRLFEMSCRPAVLPPCRHKSQGPVVGVYGHAGGSSKRDGITFSGTAAWKDAMGIDWMTGEELAQAIPPAYTEFIGRSILAVGIDSLRAIGLF